MSVATTTSSRLGAINMVQPVNWLHPLNRGLVAWWLCLPGITGGSRLVNLTRPGDKDGNHGNLTNGPTWGGALGRRGGYGRLALDGSDDYSITAINDSLKPATLTLSGWFNATSWGSYKQLVGASSTNFGSGYGIVNGVEDNGSLVGFWVNFYTSVGTNRVASITVPSTGEWFHLAGTYDLANVKLYLNGVEASSPGSYSTAINYTGVSNFVVGAGNDGGAYWFPGSIDDVRLHNRALSASEVWTLYEDSLRGYPLTLNRVRRATVFDVGGGVLKRQHLLSGGRLLNDGLLSGGVL